MPATAGKVTVKTTDQRYPVGAVITASIANGLDRTIYTEDFKTACTIAYVQRLDNGGWTDVTGCRLGRPTATVSIGAGLGRTVSFDPSSFHLTGGGGGPAFPAGSYRVKFTYRLAPEVGGDDPMTAYSVEFTIG